LLDSVVDVADLFFSGGVIVSTKYRQERQNQVHRAAPGKIVPSSTEIVILIDRGSASASEILTGALKDRNRATVIGETSFGKGSIQQMVPLNDAAIKLTTGRYYTPDGVSIDKTGIDPDIVVSEPELTDEQAASYAKLLQENRVGSFVDENPDPSRRDVDNFIRSLRADGLDPGERVIRLMVKRESERRQNIPPVVDLEFDSVLIRALDYLETGE
jgi:carboxyl-terminal processing protease